MAVASGKEIARKYLAHYINVGTSDTPTYELLGEELEELNIEMNPTVNTTTNILGTTKSELTQYEKSASISPYTAVAGTGLFTMLQAIVDEEKTLDDVVTDFVEVHTWEEATVGEYTAYKQNVVIAISSYGGNTDGYQIPFDLHYTGDKIKGTFNPTTKTFTAAE